MSVGSAAASASSRRSSRRDRLNDRSAIRIAPSTSTAAVPTAPSIAGDQVRSSGATVSSAVGGGACEVSAAASIATAPSTERSAPGVPPRVSPADQSAPAASSEMASPCGSSGSGMRIGVVPSAATIAAASPGAATL
ncbi:proteophosphoglycan 5 [Pseudonocardia dioxanivorans CB1190]|uniref:Proteophosphoglycan 5 n=1 Tax=Pseudonocardia dioxanivorans (strain ATCC 55486 / DSM 44775 / JCM 13855 / CB1190) TaxID=675635 RepID=F4CJA6_PSEUX|nr:hypothetical protein [Pseudonocardia dioxanivorans]AEA24345.1 proteophosphoglycan 5 [Pseudonocardia dioxanivorans CB1190]